MMAYAHILAPTDFSDAANAALRYAFEEATQHQATLTLLHVVQRHPTTAVYYIKGNPENHLGYVTEFGRPLPACQAAPPETVRRDYHEEALVQLRDLVQSSHTGPWQVEVASGTPADAIVRTAQKRQVSLIVMGTHGRTGLQHMLLGSVAEKVVRHAPCPVLTIGCHARGV
jgi:universal stress protein A